MAQKVGRIEKKSLGQYQCFLSLSAQVIHREDHHVNLSLRDRGQTISHHRPFQNACRSFFLLCWKEIKRSRGFSIFVLHFVQQVNIKVVRNAARIHLISAANIYASNQSRREDFFICLHLFILVFYRQIGEHMANRLKKMGLECHPDDTGENR